MLIGRRAECVRIAELFDRARNQMSSSLVIYGAAGIGKTALLDYAESIAPDFLILRATGVEAESEIPFAGLAELLQPILHHRDEIPDRQATALASALAIGPAVPGERFAVAAATLSLLAAASESQPVLCVVDDAQWLDLSSAEALAFAARRLHAEGIVMLFGMRGDTAVPTRFRALESMTLPPLSGDDAEQLLEQITGSRPPLRVVTVVQATAGGNPLALIELVHQLSERQLNGRDPLPDPLPIGSTMETAFVERIDGLPPRVRHTLLILTASDILTPGLVSAVCRTTGLPVNQLIAAESCGLITLDGAALAFRHPLIRSAIYQRASPADRREAHAVLADVLSGLQLPQRSERRAWHLAKAAVGPDESIARQIAEAAQGAAMRHSPEAAALMYEQAALLSDRIEQRLGWLLSAAREAVPAGRIEDCLRWLHEAAMLVSDPDMRAAIELEQCRLQLWTQPPAHVRERLTRLAADVEKRQPHLAADMLLAAAQASLLVYDAAYASDSSVRAEQLATGNARLVAKAAIMRALAYTQLGRPVEAEALLAAARTELDREDGLSVDQLVLTAGLCYMALERFSDARALIERVVAIARAASAAGLLAVQLPWLATLGILDGKWSAALADADEAVRLCEETGWEGHRITAVIARARIHAYLGRPESSELVASARRSAEVFGEHQIAAVAVASLGVLHLGRGEHGEAMVAMEDAMALIGRDAPPPLRGQLLPDLIEAYARTGRTASAQAGLEELQQLAAAQQRASWHARIARCRALLGDGDLDSRRAEALSWHAKGAMPFELARTQLCFGELLRRRRRRADARNLLRQALDGFEALGCAPWADRARQELAACGMTVRVHTSASPLAQLTAQELQVALAVTKGLTNQEVAATLFLSVKTVEYHLSNVYRKLHVRSRSQLVRKVA
jgi:DNA-binding CsgD family transcriptional regulator